MTVTITTPRTSQRAFESQLYRRAGYHWYWVYALTALLRTWESLLFNNWILTRIPDKSLVISLYLSVEPRPRNTDHIDTQTIISPSHELPGRGTRRVPKQQIRDGQKCDPSQDWRRQSTFGSRYLKQLSCSQVSRWCIQNKLNSPWESPTSDCGVFLHSCVCRGYVERPICRETGNEKLMFAKWWVWQGKYIGIETKETLWRELNPDETMLRELEPDEAMERKWNIGTVTIEWKSLLSRFIDLITYAG